MKVTLELKKAVLRVLQETGRRPLSPEALAIYTNAQADAPQLGMVRRQASVLDPTALTWRATEAGMREQV